MFWTMYRQFLALFVTAAVVIVPVLLISQQLLVRTLRLSYSVDFYEIADVSRRLGARLCLTMGWLFLALLAGSLGFVYAATLSTGLGSVLTFWCTVVLPMVGVLVYRQLGMWWYRRLRKYITDENWVEIVGSSYQTRLREVYLAVSVDRANVVWLLLIFVAPTLWVLEMSSPIPSVRGSAARLKRRLMRPRCV
jgi:hypothetical protein